VGVRGSEVVTASSETVTVVGLDGFFRFFRETLTVKSLSSLMLFRSTDGCVVGRAETVSAFLAWALLFGSLVAFDPPCEQ
jgi:hypothetical protein